MISSNNLLNLPKPLILSILLQNVDINSETPLHSMHKAWRIRIWTNCTFKTTSKTILQINIIKKEDLINKLKHIYFENHLQFWKLEHLRAKVELTQEVYIKEKPILYTSKDTKEFSIQIKELLEKGLIRPSKGSYSLPAFMVTNEAEQKWNKARMFINYKKLN